MYPVTSQLLDVALCRRVFPHRRVHSGGHHDWSGTGKVGRSNEVVGNAIGQLCQRVGSSGCNYKKIDRLREGDMGDRVRIVRRIVVDDYVGTGEGAKCQRLYEFTGVT